MPNIQDQLEEIRELAYKGKETAERLENNWDKDRKDFSDFQNRLGHLEVEFKSLREAVLKMPQRTQDKVDDALEIVTKLNDEIEKKKFVAYEKIKKPFWKFWKR